MVQRVPNSALLEAGLKLMTAVGLPLRKLEAKGRAMIYETDEGNSVRVRTCNDHVLVAVASSSGTETKLNLEGTDKILVIMPETPRTPGPVMAFLVPTNVALEAIRSAHGDWKTNNQSTNRTWNIWFGDDGLSTANNFARKWDAYRLRASTSVESDVTRNSKASPATLGEVILDAKRQIASAAGVPETAVKISIDLA